jgi:hypothetical protein
MAWEQFTECLGVNAFIVDRLQPYCEHWGEKSEILTFHFKKPTDGLVEWFKW